MQNESKLIRFIEWIMEGDDRLQLSKLFNNMEKWFSPLQVRVTTNDTLQIN